MRGRYSVWRIFSWFFWVAFWATLGADLLRSLQQDAYMTYAAGEILYAIDPPSLTFAQAMAQRYLFPALWDPVAIYILQSSMIFVMLPPALILSLLSRLRRRKDDCHGTIALSF